MHAFSYPVGIGDLHDLADPAPGRAFAAFGGVADQYGKDVGAMPVALDLVIWPAADRIAGRSEILNQDRHRVSLGMRLNRSHHIPGEPMIGRVVHDGPRGSICVISVGAAFAILRPPGLSLRLVALRSFLAVNVLD